jgi:hypothetical protein
MTAPVHIGAGVAPTQGMSQPMGQPMMSGGHPMPSPSGSAPVVPSASSSSGLYDPSGSAVVAPKKSSMGLILAIFAVLAIGGGVALVVILSNKDDSSGSGSGSQIASGSSDPGSGSSGPTTNGSGSAIATNGSGSGTPTTNNGSGTSGSGSAVASSGSNAGSDAGSGTTAGSGTGSGSGSAVATNGSGAGSDSGSAATVQTEIDAGVPEVKKAQVTVVGSRVKAFDVYVDGEIVALVGGEHVIEVPEGEEVEAVIKAKNYKDKTIKIGSKKRVFQFSLERIRTVTNNNTSNNTTNNNTSTNPPPPKCTGTSADLSRNAPKGCREKFCATHPDPKSQAMCDAD